MKKLFLFSMLGMIITITACSPDLDIDAPDTNTEEEAITMENLKVAANFDWKTYNDVNLTLTGNANKIVEVVSAKGVVYQKAYLSKDKAYTMKLTVPTHEASVRLLFNEQDVSIDISSGNAAYTFE